MKPASIPGVKAQVCGFLREGATGSTELPCTRHISFLTSLNLSTFISAHCQKCHNATNNLRLVIMSKSVLEKEHMREALLFYFNIKKSAVESHIMLAKTHTESALSAVTCSDWFCQF